MEHHSSILVRPSLSIKPHFCVCALTDLCGHRDELYDNVRRPLPVLRRVSLALGRGSHEHALPEAVGEPMGHGPLGRGRRLALQNQVLPVPVRGRIFQDDYLKLL